MYSVFAAELTIWSIACMAKLKVMNSHTGFTPANAEPTAMPVKPACVQTMQTADHAEQQHAHSEQGAWGLYACKNM
jgi:hypothetical protein